MRSIIAISISLFFVCSIVSGQTTRNLERDNSAAQTKKRVALVIGNGSYLHADSLPNPVNDATDMAMTLKDLGFEVISGTNQSKQQIETLIRQFGTRLADAKAVGLFFYAGHGISAGGINYLVPVDADIQTEDEIEYSSVSINFVLNKMATANNGFNMVILDACRNNPFARKWRNYRDIGDKGGLTRIDAPTGTLIAYATKPGDVAADGKGKNGLYTGALLKQMRVKNLEMGKMFQHVRADVINQSGGKQVPFDESSVVGDFYFAGIDISIANSGPPLISAPSKTGETAFWQSIENSTDLVDFENYIARTERGEFSGIYKSTAELKIFRMKKARVAAVWNSLAGTAKNLLKYDDVGSFSDGLAPVCVGKKRKCGFVDSAGREAIPLKYGSVASFSEGLASAYVPNETGVKYTLPDGSSKSLYGYGGFINKSGKEIVPIKYDRAESFVDGLALVCFRVLNSQGLEHHLNCGLIDKTGNEITPLKYDRLENRFSEGLAPACDFETKKCGFIDRKGNRVLAFKYSDVGQFSEGLAKVCTTESQTEKCGFINRDGNEVVSLPVSLKYSAIYPFSEGLAQVCDAGDLCGFIDRTGKEVVQRNYSNNYPFFQGFSEGLAAVCLGVNETAKCGYINKTGQEVIGFKYNHVNSFHDGFAWVCKDTYGNRKCGVIDSGGREITPIKYTGGEGYTVGAWGAEEHGNFVDGIEQVNVGEGKTKKIGFVDRSGREIIPLKYDEVWCETFRNQGFVGVVLNGKKGFVDIYGNEYFDLE